MGHLENGPKVFSVPCSVVFLGHPVVGHEECVQYMRCQPCRRYSGILAAVINWENASTEPNRVRTKDVERNYISKIPPVQKTCALYESNPI